MSFIVAASRGDSRNELPLAALSHSAPSSASKAPSAVVQGFAFVVCFFLFMFGFFFFF
jgi:hypothetical protein